MTASQVILDEILKVNVEALYVSESPDDERKEYIKRTFRSVFEQLVDFTDM